MADMLLVISCRQLVGRFMLCYICWYPQQFAYIGYCVYGVSQ